MKERRGEAQELALKLIERAEPMANAIELPDELIRQVEDAALVVCYGRASVPRDSSPRREITGLPEIEEPPRVAKQLIMLVRCLLALGLSDDEAMGIVSRVAIDTMPAIRALALGAVVDADGPITTAAIAKTEGCDWKVVNRALEDLQAIGLLRHATDNANAWDEAASAGNEGHGAAQAKPWVLDHEDADLVRAAFERRKTAVMPELAGRALDEVSTVCIQAQR
jgi:hypothetical protein